MEKKLFGTKNGENIFLFSLENKNGMKVTLSNFGALIIKLEVPDKNRKVADVALGYDTLEEYIENYNFYGAIIGPNANRIANARYILDGVEYKLDENDDTNNLHSHREIGLHKRIWSYKEYDNEIEFSLKLKDGEMGFGGNKDITVKYMLSEDNGLSITYYATSDKDTIINMTNHCYFNLDGQGAGSIKNHKLQLFASAYTPVDSKLIPIGDILKVENTPMDFRKMQKIGERIDDDFEQLKISGGYDHNFVCDNYNGQVRKIAVIKNTDETRTMEVYTDLPGVQFYSGNFMKYEIGKDGAIYDKNGGFALETQFYPDSANKPQFPSTVFGPDRPYQTRTIYKFI